MLLYFANNFLKGAFMKQNTRRVVFTALTVAMTTVLTLVSIALPGGGYYNFGDLAIFVSAIVLGPVSGLITGAIGAALGDVILGYFAYVPFTMIAKALEGLIAGLVAKAAANFCKKFHKREMLEAFLSTLGNILGGFVMACGYFLAEGLLLAEGKWSGGIINLPWNLLQGTISALLAGLLLFALHLKKPLTKAYLGNNSNENRQTTDSTAINNTKDDKVQNDTSVENTDDNTPNNTESNTKDKN